MDKVKMKIQFCSDLHLEFKENKQLLNTCPIKPIGDILILAGDIILFRDLDNHNDFFTYVSDNFKTTYWIPGNHEYYHFDIATKSGVLNEKIKSNVFLVNNISISIEDINLIFSTLWTNISPAYEWQITRNMNDFQVIKYGSNRFSALYYNKLHQDSMEFLTKEIQNNKYEKTIISTHHVPTFLNYPKEFKGSILNEGFATELFDFIEKSSVDYWIYGHHHSNIPTFEIGKTKMITNQLGYVSYGEHKSFYFDRIIDL